MVVSSDLPSIYRQSLVCDGAASGLMYHAVQLQFARMCHRPRHHWRNAVSALAERRCGCFSSGRGRNSYLVQAKRIHGFRCAAPLAGP